MILLVLFLFAAFTALGAGVLSALSDMRGLMIPNIYSVIVIVSFLFAYVVLWISGGEKTGWPIVTHLLSGVLTFSITALLFSLKTLGAADSKLVTAYALWFRLSDLPMFLAYVTLAGGVLAVVALVIKKKKPFTAPKEGGWIYRLQAGESKVPYGVAIFAGALFAFLKAGYFSGGYLAAFL